MFYDYASGFMPLIDLAVLTAWVLVLVGALLWLVGRRQERRAAAGR